jgi:hypothetical protein
MPEQLPTKTDLILVAYLPSLRDLEIARVLGWYRIPLRSAPKVIAVDYIAFYQPSKFGENKWRIEYFARVNGHELVTRAELFTDQLDHPSAHEEYYKIQLGPVIRLPNPILAQKWRRITFFYTTGQYFSQAEIIADLVVQTDERHLLWKALRDRTRLSQAYQSPSLPGFDLDPELLANVLGISDFFVDYDN